MHRIRYSKLTPEQITSKLSAANGPTSASPLSETLAGKSLRIALDSGPALRYRFGNGNRLSLTEGSAAAVDAGYGALTLDRLVLFSHLIPRTQRRNTVVIDQDTSLVTVFEVWFSGYEDNREVQRQICAPCSSRRVGSSGAGAAPPARTCARGPRHWPRAADDGLRSSRWRDASRESCMRCGEIRRSLPRGGARPWLHSGRQEVRRERGRADSRGVRAVSPMAAGESRDQDGAPSHPNPMMRSDGRRSLGNANRRLTELA